MVSGVPEGAQGAAVKGIATVLSPRAGGAHLSCGLGTRYSPRVLRRNDGFATRTTMPATSAQSPVPVPFACQTCPPSPQRPTPGWA